MSRTDWVDWFGRSNVTECGAVAKESLHTCATWASTPCSCCAARVPKYIRTHFSVVTENSPSRRQSTFPTPPNNCAASTLWRQSFKSSSRPIAFAPKPPALRRHQGAGDRTGNSHPYPEGPALMSLRRLHRTGFEYLKARTMLMARRTCVRSSPCAAAS